MKHSQPGPPGGCLPGIRQFLSIGSPVDATVSDDPAANWHPFSTRAERLRARPVMAGTAEHRAIAPPPRVHALGPLR